MKKLLLMLSIFFFSINSVFAYEKVKYKSCIDGDTIKVTLKDEVYTVRMLAVNTPETGHMANTKKEYYGEEASEYTCKKIKNAKSIELEYDSKSDRTDKYGRLLAWVYVDGNLLQEDLVRNGYAKVAYLYDDYKYADKLKKIQEEVSKEEIGVWNEEALSKYDSGSSMSSSYIEESLDDNDITLIDIIIIGIVFLVFIFASDMTVKVKAKKKLKKYVK